MVTGAASGIGRASALALGQAKAPPSASPISTCEGAQETARLISDAGGQALARPCDVTNKRRSTGYGRCDRDLPSAGWMPRSTTPVSPGISISDLHEADDETFERVIDVNLRGVWYIA